MMDNKWNLTISASPHVRYSETTGRIMADVLIALAPAIARHLKPGGHLVASGIILPRREEVIAALEAEGLTVAGDREQEGWCALLMQKG